ncbi:glycosyltransferase family 2 protein [Nocardioides mangrovi]|uniref:Glycosyltransferase n=1 Tax=Nocardioides mangrovi TaxID=2874580 RepID=A0ABS7UGC6_9ACTN|nr:glycosyltransferase family 2 protein [Nocardioides mangrovi]MBZ5739731.1 glycosyltransferase [Nocardioides mangrovi]
MGSPAVSVVVPTHQRPELMRRAVASVVAQDYDGEVEVIVVFDACEPFVPDVELPERRTLRVVSNRRTRGLAGARNTGIVEAAHDFVAFLDDDDWWLPGKLTAQMPLFDRPEHPVLVGTAAVFDDGEHQHERPVPFDLVTHDELLRDRMAGLHSSTFVLRRDAMLGDLGLVDEELPGSYGEDYDLLLRSSAITPIPVANQPLVSVTWSQSSYFFGRWGAYAEGLEYLCATHPGFEQDPKAQGRIAAQIAFARAAHGDRALARSWVRRSIRRDPTQVKAWLALAISLRLVSVTWVVAMVQRAGRGI